MSNSDFPPSEPFEILTKAASMRIAKFRYTILILSLVDRFSDVMEIKYVLINLDFIKTDAFLSFNHPEFYKVLLASLAKSKDHAMMNDRRLPDHGFLPSSSRVLMSSSSNKSKFWQVLSAH